MEWLAGNRLRGTTAERPNFGLPSGSVGGWVELARTTLGSDTATVDVSSLDDKRYYMVLSNYNISSGNGNPYFRLNSDIGSNYSARYSLNGSEATNTSQGNGMYGAVAGYNLLPYFTIDYFANLSGKEKLHIGHVAHQNTAGAANAPNRGERHLKHAQTSNPITSYNLWNASGSGDFASGSECVVLGWDPADTHTTNFWQELASVDLSGGAADTLDASFTAKKYLWIQCYAVNSGSGGDHLNLRLGNTTIDSGNNYSFRYSLDGASDGTLLNQTDLNVFQGATVDEKMFVNIFIVNNASNEKLIICHGVSDNSSTGAANAPARTEMVGKWTNTSNQADILQFFNQGAGTLTGNSTARIWGSD